ncbi:MAG: hypothetical protein H0T89_35525 [Deltaproteobacteria bacterium]|nr:hypothetical protein [Deltaproteobacteria bacterium]
MRIAPLLLLVCAACNPEVDGAAEPPPESVRERLQAGETRLMLSAADSAGSITARRKVAGGAWDVGLADLAVDHGELVTSADASGAITLDRLEITFAPIAIPPGVFGGDAALTNVRAVLAKPATATTAWVDDDEAHTTVTLDLDVSWALTIGGGTVQLGSPHLPPVTLHVDFTGTGAFVHADVRATARGELWSWADLVKLEDLQLIVGADTP